MSEVSALHPDKYKICDMENSRIEFKNKILLSDDYNSGNKMNIDPSYTKSEIKKDLILGPQKLNFKEYKMDGLSIHGVPSDKSKQTTFNNTNLHDDNIKSNNSQVSSRILNIPFYSYLFFAN